MSDIGWILIIYLIGLLAIVAELLLPGAVIGIIGFLIVCGSIVYAFITGHVVTGIILVLATLVSVPLFFFIWKSVLGRVFGSAGTEKGFHATAADYGELAGKEGEAISPLRPSGVVAIEGKRYSVVTRGEMLEKGTRVRVIDVAGSKIVVKKV
jgi:membrane-bound serine protease (ClpP class)